MNAGQQLYQRARTLIPGGTQLLSKRPEMFLPEQWPAYYQHAQGCEVVDLDGRRLIDMTHCGVGACTLGYADPDVTAAVVAAVQAGSMTVLNCPEEVELAELLCELHPWAGRVRFARCGGESCAVAVRIARAATGRDTVAFCGYHGWNDWYLAANLGAEGALDGHLLTGLEPAGVPRALRGTALPFNFGDRAQLEAIVREHGGDLAAIIMEPIRNAADVEFLKFCRAQATRCGAVLIFDEVSAGFRLYCGGSHMTLGVEPDLAVLAKAISNGHPMGAVIGRAAVMEAAQKSFISSTYWTERVGPAAALATIRKYRRLGVEKHLNAIGMQVQRGWEQAAQAAGLTLHAGGIPPLSHFAVEGPEGLAARTLFTQLMLERGYLAGAGFYPMLAHTPDIVARYLEQVAEIFGLIASAQRAGRLAGQLKGPLAHTGFKRLN
jgi:glutamate-1-semialdehyde 2,1-aminomutase